MFSRLLVTSASLSILLAVIILLACSLFATRGGEIAFESDRDGNWEIYRLDLTTSVSFNLTRSAADDFAPAWSPDGKKIAFSADRDGNGQPEIYMMNANGSDLRQVSTGSGGYRSPSWSRDGRSLVFVLGFGQIYQMNEDGSGEQWLGRGFLPSLSADHTWLLYSAESTSTIDADIFVANVTTHQSLNLTNNRANEWGARWSPDNEQIVFATLRGSKTHIYVMNADGSDERGITNTGANETSPAWSFDGGSIVYSAETNGSKQLYVVTADGGNPQQITAGAGNHQSPAWRPVSG
jgi:TolB protein